MGFNDVLNIFRAKESKNNDFEISKGKDFSELRKQLDQGDDDYITNPEVNTPLTRAEAIKMFGLKLPESTINEAPISTTKSKSEYLEVSSQRQDATEKFQLFYTALQEGKVNGDDVRHLLDSSAPTPKYPDSESGRTLQKIVDGFAYFINALQKNIVSGEDVAGFIQSQQDLVPSGESEDLASTESVC